MAPTLALIVAAADNDVIGASNELPWHLPADLAHFKRTTMGKPIIMGRKTFESIGRPLPGRLNVVISRNPELSFNGVTMAGSLDEAIATATDSLADTRERELMVIGGAEIYRQALTLAKRIYLTRVHLTPDGDAWFPQLDSAQWREVSAQSFPARDGFPAYRFVVLNRIGP